MENKPPTNEDPQSPDLTPEDGAPEAPSTPDSPPDSAPTPTPRPLRPRPSRATLREAFLKAVGHSDQQSVEQQINRRTFIAFATWFTLGAAAWKSWSWIKDAAPGDGVQTPLRKALNVDDKIFRHAFSNDHLVKTFPKSAAARNVRYNSGIGLGTNGFDAAKWNLQVTTAGDRTLNVSIDELRQLPKSEIVFEFKCIEGWSQVSWWGGVKFSDFVQHYGLQTEIALDYVGLSTPDDQYYVGIDTPSALHPQTLLCYEMNGTPLQPRHGAPLRLIIPVKYGVKNLKRIGKMFFSNDRPRDYWFERGYDYYCGL
jgi:hypothetical protein